MAYWGAMKYFMLMDREKNPFPLIINWSQTMDIRKLNRAHYRELPSFFMLDMKRRMDAALPDLIVSSFLLLSRPAMEITALYDPGIPFRFTVLFDIQHEECGAYYCPILEKEDCVEERAGEVRLARKRMTGLPLFQIVIRENRKTVIRMDLAESLLEREAVGVELQEIDLTE